MFTFTLAKDTLENVLENVVDALEILDVPDVLDDSDILGVTDALDVYDIFNVTNVFDVTDIIEAPVINNANDVTNITSTVEILKVHHHTEMEYDAYGPPVLPSSSSPAISRPSRKPSYSKQCGGTNPHDMSPYESPQAHVHEVEPVVVSDDDITDDLGHSDDDIYDVSYEMDPFGIDTPVDIIQDDVSKLTPHPGMNEIACVPQDKWFGLNQKTKDLRDKIDDNYK
jgi:hypothetical protein